VIAERQRRWLLAALACAAMLVLPVLTWLLAPRPDILVLPPTPSAALVTTTPAAPPSAPRRTSVVRPANALLSAASTPPMEAGPVTGIVLDPDGRPAPKAFVGCDQTLATTTDDDGRFTLPAEALGCLAVARHPDFIGSEPTPLVAGRSNTLRLNRRGGIEGDVADERGVPVASYLLAVESYQGPSADSAPTGQLKEIQDPRGVFAWENLVPGRYVLTASGGGRPPSRSGPVDVDVGRVTAHVRITLSRGATLTGHVLDANTRKPVADALVALDAFTSTRANSVRPARSDDQGAYTLEGAPAGPFSVRVAREGYRARIVTGLTTRGAPTLQQDVELNPMVDGGPTGDDFAGIGAILAPSQGGVTVARLTPNGPAEQAGIRPGDLIRRIDGADTSSLALFECMQSLRGPEGSRVSVQIERAGQRVDVTIQRRAFTL
jgi:hypothetical protein